MCFRIAQGEENAVSFELLQQDAALSMEEPCRHITGTTWYEARSPCEGPGSDFGDTPDTVDNGQSGRGAACSRA